MESSFNFITRQLQTRMSGLHRQLPSRKAILRPSNFPLLFLTVFVLVHSVIIFASPLLPFIDLPNHLAEAAIYKYIGSDNRFSEFYTTSPWYYPNTFHTLFCAAFPSVEFGNKVFHFLCIAGIGASAFLVIHELKGNPWFALLALLFTYNYNLTYGFVGFAISIPVLILLFYVILLDQRVNNWKTKTIISVLLVLLFFMHAQNALLGLVIFGAICLYQNRKHLMNFFIRAALIPLPVLVFILIWWTNREKSSSEGSTLDYLAGYYQHDYWQTFSMRLRLPVLDNFQLYAGWPGVAAALVFFLVIVTCMSTISWRTLRQNVFSSDRIVYPFALFIAVVACYAVLPDKLPGQTPLFQRFCTMAMLTLIIALSVMSRTEISRGLKTLVCLSIIMYSVCWGDYLIGFNRENRDFNSGWLSAYDRNATFAGLTYDNTYRGRKVYIHYPNYFITWNHGIAASKIIDYRFGIVRRSEQAKLPYYNELIGDGYREISEYKNIDYLLVRGLAPVHRDKNLEGFVLDRHTGEWRIYRNLSMRYTTLR